MDQDWPWLSLDSPYWSNPFIDTGGVNTIRSLLRRMPEIEQALETSPTEAHLVALEMLDLLESAIKRERRLIVLAARAKGVSWNVIARQLRCSRQAAQQRFGSALPDELIEELKQEIRNAYHYAQHIIAYQAQYSDDDFGNALDFVELFEEPP